MIKSYLCVISRHKFHFWFKLTFFVKSVQTIIPSKLLGWWGLGVGGLDGLTENDAELDGAMADLTLAI